MYMNIQPKINSLGKLGCFIIVKRHENNKINNQYYEYDKKIWTKADQDETLLLFYNVIHKTVTRWVTLVFRLANYFYYKLII